MSGEENGRAVEQIGVLGNCLIEGDAEQKTRERKTKRRALTISILLQSLAIVAIVMVPLLGHTEKISYKVLTPIPPYRHQPVRPTVEHVSRPQAPRNDAYYKPSSDRPKIAIRDNQPPTSDTIADGIDMLTPGTPNRDGLGFADNRVGPAPPEEPNRNKKRRISVGGDVQGAMLIRRVAPAYPALPRQLHRSGVVHIRAVISTEGNIESLQVLDGDPLFIQSAKDAVSQWRYRPTSLNGVPVEVETIITVVYTLNQ
jgi:periplasmic protein TonB